MRTVRYFLLIIVAVISLSQRANAEVFLGCTLKISLGQNAAGTKIDLQIPNTGEFDVVNWSDAFCELDPIFRLVGDVDLKMEGAIKRIYDSFNKSSRLSIMRNNYIPVIFHVESQGGDVEAALRIGRVLRELNAWVFVPYNSVCFSACVLIVAGGVDRTIIGFLGIHRPYLSVLDRGQREREVVIQVTRIDNLISSYLREMRIPLSLLDAMKGVAPQDMRILSAEALQNFGLNSSDPIFDEMRTAHDAYRFGTNSAELRRRQAIANQCLLSGHQEVESCMFSVFYGLIETEYKKRKQRVAEVCGIPRGAIHAPMWRGSEKDFETLATCQRDIMLGFR
jgi:hypothetical protein